MDLNIDVIDALQATTNWSKIAAKAKQSRGKRAVLIRNLSIQKLNVVVLVQGILPHTTRRSYDNVIFHDLRL